MSYKRLGNYIIEKVEFNEGNKYDLLQGVSNNKYFQKAKTNTIGVDLSKYRVAHHNQFVFNRATTRNGDKISIALRKGETCIVSPSYRIFEVADENVLNPDYLLMWFKRPEFDRYARFKSHGSAHEFFDMDEMNDVELPIPSIEKQREIVAQYEAVANKIKVNEAICDKLEATAQALYKQWFVDFEFPNEDGQPYKSSGGVMVFNEELEKEIPEGWDVKSLGEHISLSQGIQVDVENQFLNKKKLNRFLRIVDYSNNSNEAQRFVDIYDDRYFVKVDDVVVIRYGESAGRICRRLEGIIANNLFKVNPISRFLNKNILFYHLINPSVQSIIKGSSGSSAMPAISHGDIKNLKLCYNPDSKIYDIFNIYVESLEKLLILNTSKNQKLTQLQSLLLSRLATLESEVEIIN